MEIDKRLFEAKIKELRNEINKMQCRMDLIEKGDADEMMKELLVIKEEAEQKVEEIKNAADSSKSVIARDVARIQLDYFKNMHDDIHKRVAEAKNAGEADKSEIQALFAEYALDYAIQAMRGAVATSYLVSGIPLDIEKYMTNPDKC